MDTSVNTVWVPAALEALLLGLALLAALVSVVLRKTHRGSARLRRLVAMAGGATLVVLLGRSWFIEPVHVPSASMVPTLLVGDFLLVQRFPYRLSWPVSGKQMIATGQPARGDIVVFSLPDRPDFRMVKRVVGVAGDEVVSLPGAWYVNGKRLEQTPLAPYEDPRSGPESVGRTVLKESLAGRMFGTLKGTAPEPARFWKVPEGQVFVLGDNRGLSKDSRDFGFVDQRRITGRVARVLFNATGWDRWARPVGDDKDLVSR